MKIKIILFWVILVSFLVLFVGCITTPAKKVAGIVPTGHGTYRLQSAVDRENREAAAEAAREKALATQVKLPPVKSRPKDTSITPVEPTHVPPVPAVLTPFEPTVSEAELPPLPPLSPSQALIKMGEEAEANRVLPTVLQETGDVVVDQTNDSATNVPKEFPPIKVKWGSLFLYYFVAAFILGWLGFKYKHLILKQNEKPKRTTRRNKKVRK